MMHQLIDRYIFKTWKTQLEEELSKKRNSTDFSIDDWKEDWFKKIEERDLLDKRFVKKILWISTVISVAITVLVFFLFDFKVNLRDLNIQNILMSINLGLYASLNLIHTDLRITFHKRSVEYIKEIK